MTTNTIKNLFLRCLGCLVLLSIGGWDSATAVEPFGGAPPTEHSSLDGGPIGADKGLIVCCLSPWECTGSCFDQKDRCERGCQNTAHEGECLVNCHVTFEECNKKVDELVKKCTFSSPWRGVMIQSAGPACSACAPRTAEPDFGC